MRRNLFDYIHIVTSEEHSNETWTVKGEATYYLQTFTFLLNESAYSFSVIQSWRRGALALQLGDVASWLFYVPLFGHIASGPVPLKRNKGLGGTYTPFSALTTRTTPLHHASCTSKTPQSQALALLECLAPKEADSIPFQHYYPMIH